MTRSSYRAWWGVIGRVLPKPAALMREALSETLPVRIATGEIRAYLPVSSDEGMAAGSGTSLVVREFVDSSQNSRKHDLALMAWLVASPSDKPSKLVISLFLVVGKFSCNQLQGKRIIKWRLQRWRLYVIATVSDFCWLRASPHMSGCGMSDSKVIGRIRSQGTSRIFSIVCISHITN